MIVYKLKHRLSVLLLVFIASNGVFAQQDAQASMYMFNPLQFNPGYTGSRGALNATLVNRAQWIGVSGAPVTQFLSVHAPIARKAFGIGGHFSNDIIGEKYNFKLTDAIETISEEAMEMILNGGKEKFTIESKTLGVTKEYKIEFEGISHFIKNQHDESGSATIKRWAKEFMDEIKCPVCEGSRLKKEALFFKINEKKITELCNLDISDLTIWFHELNNQLSDKQKIMATEVIK